MRLLLDTHVALWAVGAPGRLGERCAEAVRSRRHDVFVSAVTAVEVAIKQALGKLDTTDDIPEGLQRQGFTELPLTARHGWSLRELPALHGDPFDRLLVAQARVEGLTLVTADAAILSYDVPTMDQRA